MTKIAYFCLLLGFLAGCTTVKCSHHKGVAPVSVRWSIVSTNEVALCYFNNSVDDLLLEVEERLSLHVSQLDLSGNRSELVYYPSPRQKIYVLLTGKINNRHNSCSGVFFTTGRIQQDTAIDLSRIMNVKMDIRAVPIPSLSDVRDTRRWEEIFKNNCWSVEGVKGE